MKKQPPRSLRSLPPEGERSPLGLPGGRAMPRITHAALRRERMWRVLRFAEGGRGWLSARLLAAMASTSAQKVTPAEARAWLARLAEQGLAELRFPGCPAALNEYRLTPAAAQLPAPPSGRGRRRHAA